MKQSFTMFKKLITEEVWKIKADNLEVILREMTKNNGTIHSALEFREQGEVVSVLVYLAPYFEDYTAGVSLKELAEDIYSSYQENKKHGRIFESSIWCND